MKLSVIVPAYNEERTIQSILTSLSQVELIGGFSKEIIVVDDCSSDQTGQEVHQFQINHPAVPINYTRHAVNCGKGAAIRTGIEQATGDYIIVQDADLEYDPQEFNLLLKPVVRGVADVVYGSRFMGGCPHRVLFFWHTIGNKFLTTLSNAFNDLNITDMETCYKLVKTSLIQQIQLKENRFGFEPELTAKIARIPGVRIYEVGISYYGRTYAEGKKIGWRDGFRALYSIIRYGLFPDSIPVTKSKTVDHHEHALHV